MIFKFDKEPDNKALKELFPWRDSLVIDSQQVNLVNKIADEMCFRSKLLSYVKLSEEPVTENGRTVLKKGTAVTFFTIQTKNGEKFYPLFTSEEELKGWQGPEQQDPQKVLIEFNDLMPILNSTEGLTGIVVNPMSDNFMMPKELVEQWTKRKAEFLELVKRQAEAMKAAQEKAKAQDPAVKEGKVVSIHGEQ